MRDYSTTVIEKAKGLIEKGGLRDDPEVPDLFWVEAASRTSEYRVQVIRNEKGQPIFVSCTCAHGLAAGGGQAHCSHAVAVLMVLGARDG